MGIVIVSYNIYSNWYKTSMNKGDYNALNIKEMLCQQLSFYCKVYEHVLSQKQWKI